MCGIVGYVGNKNRAVDFVLKGLQALEYRGYDSAGLTTIIDKKAVNFKQVGQVETLKNQVEESGLGSGNIAIGHTRWATHGSPTILNAHPHFNKDETIFVVHNGIVENYRELRQFLRKQGYSFKTQTDTEVIPHLIDYYLKKTNKYSVAFEMAIKDLKGAYAVHRFTPMSLTPCL